LENKVSIVMVALMFATIVLVAAYPVPGSVARDAGQRITKSTDVVLSSTVDANRATGGSAVYPYQSNLVRDVTKGTNTTLEMTVAVTNPVSVSGIVSTPLDKTIPMTESFVSGGVVTLTLTLGPNWAAGTYRVSVSIMNGRDTLPAVLSTYQSD
jgi:hypothetical protein